jgi:hypothetical protein
MRDADLRPEWLRPLAQSQYAFAVLYVRNAPIQASNVFANLDAEPGPYSDKIIHTQSLP